MRHSAPTSSSEAEIRSRTRTFYWVLWVMTGSCLIRIFSVVKAPCSSAPCTHVYTPFTHLRRGSCYAGAISTWYRCPVRTQSGICRSTGAPRAIYLFPERRALSQPLIVSLACSRNADGLPTPDSRAAAARTAAWPRGPHSSAALSPPLGGGKVTLPSRGPPTPGMLGVAEAGSADERRPRAAPRARREAARPGQPAPGSGPPPPLPVMAAARPRQRDEAAGWEVAFPRSWAPGAERGRRPARSRRRYVAAGGDRGPRSGGGRREGRACGASRAAWEGDGCSALPRERGRRRAESRWPRTAGAPTRRGSCAGRAGPVRRWPGVSFCSCRLTLGKVPRVWPRVKHRLCFLFLRFSELTSNRFSWTLWNQMGRLS